MAIIAGNLLASGCNALTMLKMARHLTGREWGVFGYLMSWMEVFRVVSNFGLDVVAVRIMAIGRHGPRAVMRHLVLLNSAMVGVVLLVILVLSLVLGGFREHRMLVLLLGVGLLPIIYTQSLCVRFQTEHAMDRLIPVRLAAGLLLLGAVYLAVAADLRLTSFVMVYVGYQAATLIFTLIAGRLTWPPRKEPWGPFQRPLLSELLRHGIPAGLEALVVVLYQRLGVMFIEHYKGMDAVGQFYIAVRISEPLLMVSGALAASTFPVLSRLADLGKIAELKRRFVYYSLRSAAPSICFAVVLTLLARELLVWIKPAYAPATGALIALAWAAAVIFQNAISVTVVKAFGKFHYVTIFATINLLVFLGLSLNLIPSHGASGAGWSTLGTESLNCVFHLAAVFVLMRRQGKG